jgi:hypothetical protein
MANSVTSNIREKIAPVFASAFESSRVLSKTVNTSYFRGKFGPDSGNTSAIKRPHQYGTIETTGGDISSSTKSDIISGSITCTKQNVITVAMEWGSVDEALYLNQLDEILKPAAEDLCIQLESNLATYMQKNLGVTYGTHGTAVDAWSDVAGCAAMLKSLGCGTGERYYVMDPFVELDLSDAQTGLSADPSRLVQNAWEEAQISKNFGGMRALTSNALPSFTNTTAADLVGALSANPTVTYLGAKDTMTQTWAVTGFTASATVKAGSTVEVTGRYQTNVRNGETIYKDGSPVKFRGVVTADVTLDGSGEGNLVVAGAGIYETTAQYNTTDSALVSGDVVTILGTSGTEYKPNLYYHKDAISMTAVKQRKLYSTDTIFTTKDGLPIRISKYADGDANKQMIRFDLIPCFATVSPFMGGQAYGL